MPSPNPSPPKHFLRALAIAAWVLGAGSFTTERVHADDGAAKPRPAADYLPAAVKRLRTAGTIDTDIEQTVHFGARSTVAKGHYTQGTELRLRLEFSVQIGRVKGDLLQVCDGEDLWAQQTIGDDVRLTVRKVGEIIAAARRSPLTTDRIMMAELGLGGLSGMLASIDEVTTFDEVEVEKVGGIPLHVVRGRWSNEFRAQFAGNEQLEAVTPDVVEIAFDETDFPRRIRYLREQDNTLQRLVTLEFRNTTIGGKVDPSLFKYETPDGVFPKNVTADYIQKLQKSPNPPQPPAQPQ